MEYHREIQVFWSQAEVPSQMCCVIYRPPIEHCDHRLCRHVPPPRYLHSN